MNVWILESKGVKSLVCLYYYFDIGQVKIGYLILSTIEWDLRTVFKNNHRSLIKLKNTFRRTIQLKNRDEKPWATMFTTPVSYCRPNFHVWSPTRTSLPIDTTLVHQTNTSNRPRDVWNWKSCRFVYIWAHRAELCCKCYAKRYGTLLRRTTSMITTPEEKNVDPQWKQQGVKMWGGQNENVHLNSRVWGQRHVLLTQHIDWVQTNVSPMQFTRIIKSISTLLRKQSHHFQPLIVFFRSLVFSTHFLHCTLSSSPTYDKFYLFSY